MTYPEMEREEEAFAKKLNHGSLLSWHVVKSFSMLIAYKSLFIWTISIAHQLSITINNFELNFFKAHSY